MSEVWLGTFAIALVGCFVTMLGLGIGTLFGRKPLRGSCDGSCGVACGGRSCDTRAATRHVAEERA